MKPIPALLLILLPLHASPLPASPPGADPQPTAAYPPGIGPGSTEAQVATILGQPESSIELGTQKTVHYRLAKIVFEEGRLVQGTFITEQERAREETDRLALHQEALARKEKQRAENLARAIAKRDEKLQNPDFLLDTPENRLRFWRNLKRQCPELDLGPQIQETVQDLKEFQKLQVANRIRVLEAKAAQLEKQAADAEKKALAAEKKVAKAEARLERIKLEAARFPVVNPIVYPRSTGIYVGPSGRHPIRYDPVSGTWRPVYVRPTLQINIR